MKVYLITNKVNGKQYVGITVQELRERFNQHARYDGMVINSAIKKHGKENFTIELLDECTSLEELREKETYYIKTLNTMTPNGYNVSGGGEGLAGESRYKISKALLGKKKTKEHAERIRLGQIGKHHSEVTKQKLRAINTGKHHSEETRQKISLANKENFKSNPTRIEASKRGGYAIKGRPVKEDTRKKISDSLKGKPNKHTRCNLTVDDRDSILEKLANGEKMNKVAKEYNVSYDTIKAIKYGTHWLCKEE